MDPVQEVYSKKCTKVWSRRFRRCYLYRIQKLLYMINSISKFWASTKTIVHVAKPTIENSKRETKLRKKLWPWYQYHGARRPVILTLTKKLKVKSTHNPSVGTTVLDHHSLWLIWEYRTLVFYRLFPRRSRLDQSGLKWVCFSSLLTVWFQLVSQFSIHNWPISE